jgi:hypothetical protein
VVNLLSLLRHQPLNIWLLLVAALVGGGLVEAVEQVDIEHPLLFLLLRLLIIQLP